MSETTIPQPIIDAINAMLAPYGKKYDPAVRLGASGGKGYMNLGSAAKYMGVSKSLIQRLVKAGHLPPPYKLTAAKNGAALYAVEDLDAYVRAHR